jgi:hypothetical protein
MTFDHRITDELKKTGQVAGNGHADHVGQDDHAPTLGIEHRFGRNVLTIDHTDIERCRRLDLKTQWRNFPGGMTSRLVMISCMPASLSDKNLPGRKWGAWWGTNPKICLDPRWLRR